MTAAIRSTSTRPLRRLDLHLEADLPVEPVRRLEPGQGLVDELDVGSALDLRQDDAIEARRGARHDELRSPRHHSVASPLMRTASVFARHP